MFIVVFAADVSSEALKERSLARDNGQRERKRGAFLPSLVVDAMCRRRRRLCWQNECPNRATFAEGSEFRSKLAGCLQVWLAVVVDREPNVPFSFFRHGSWPHLILAPCCAALTRMF